MTSSCRACGNALNRAANGRPPTYCSTGCRRSVEYELRRLQSRLERLADQRDLIDRRLAEYQVATPFGTSVIAKTRADRDAVEQLIADAEARLRGLLDTQETD